MQIDKEGFLYPQINDELCTECGACIKVCAFQNGYDTSANLETPLVFAVRHKEKSVLLSSRSGGTFTAISNFVLKNEGAIYGAGYAEGFRVIHKRAISKEGYEEFRGSKYVQSELNNIFKLIQDDLRSDRHVLFCGTPCQTAGLQSYLHKIDTEKLLLCDIVCHGVPSPQIWSDYITYIEKKNNSKIEHVNFRDKECGWTDHIESFVFKNKKKKFYKTYTDIFYSHLTLRPACGNCKYTNFKRPSDITLADFWGWEKTAPTFNQDDKGVSLVLLNTEKGNMIFNAIKHELDYLESDTSKCIQPNLVRPTSIPENRSEFWADYQKNGFLFIAKKYSDLDFKSQFKHFKRRVKSKILSPLGLKEPYKL